jgi:hypothetical protein
MKLKMLLGCVGLVIILLLVSLTNVVGRQSSSSDSVHRSPLFRIRMQNAVAQERTTVLASDFLGKGTNTLFVPKPDDITMLCQTVIERIRAMDDETFDRFVQYLVQKINRHHALESIDDKELIQELRQLRGSTESTLVYTEMDADKITYFNDNGPTICWFPGCLVLYGLLWIGQVMFIMSIFLITFFSGRDCFETSFSMCCS